MQYGHISDFMKRDTADILSGYSLDPEKGISCTGPDGGELSVVLAGGDSEGKGVGMALPDADYGTISVSSFVQQVATVAVEVNPDGKFSISQASLSTPAAIAASVAAVSSASIASVSSAASASSASIASASSAFVASVASASSASVASSRSSSTTSSTTPRYHLQIYLPRKFKRAQRSKRGEGKKEYLVVSKVPAGSQSERVTQTKDDIVTQTNDRVFSPAVGTKRQAVPGAPPALTLYIASQLSSACSRAITSPTSIRTVAVASYIVVSETATGVFTSYTNVATSISTSSVPPLQRLRVSSYKNYYLANLAAVDSYGSVARGWAPADSANAKRFYFSNLKNSNGAYMSDDSGTTLQLWMNNTDGQMYLLNPSQQVQYASEAYYISWTVTMRNTWYILQPSGAKTVMGACLDTGTNFVRFFLFAQPSSGSPNFAGGNAQWTGCATIPYFALCKACHLDNNGNIVDGETRRMFEDV
ncbi:hypothetical protein TWF718_010281 [Orbilia javanica]|uniref:Uncharacterized protein n=1 Tax=Orbilia javanica TaxID=47235 RepID=A0AAN8MJG3_9PEZI